MRGLRQALRRMVSAAVSAEVRDLQWERRQLRHRVEILCAELRDAWEKGEGLTTQLAQTDATMECIQEDLTCLRVALSVCPGCGRFDPSAPESCISQQSLQTTGYCGARVPARAVRAS